MAKSEEGRWLTYEELAKELSSTVGAARILAVRRKYPRRIPNAYGERTRVLVPEKIEAPRHRRGHLGRTSGPTETDSTPDKQDKAHLGQALDSLREQLRIANERADRAEKHAEEEIREMRAQLTDARGTVDDLRRRLDDEAAERRQLTVLLADLQKPQPQRRSWWRWGRSA